jgi:membrane-associated phospholipid phosphatase
MLNRPCRLNEKWIGSALALTPLLVLCVRFLDIPVALYVRNRLYSNTHWSKLTSNLPDLLLMVVLLTTFVAFSLYLIRTKKGIYDTATSFEKLVTWAAPVSYLTKSVLKFVFGRVNTRTWLQEPGLYGFHWFQRREGCEGFPSGHMIVIVTLFAALWRFYPKSRPFCLAIASLLGIALIATNYHFLSDVIAGAYLGVLIEAIVFRILLHEPPRLGSSVL